ncbi:MAG: hypothetical protein ACE14M_00750 [Terriglobales bacterium]
MIRIRKRTIPIVVAVTLVAIAVVAAVLLRRRAAPEPARLLPEADGYIYVNLKPLRIAGVIGKNVPVSDDVGYEEFVRATGFVFERDLDEAAFAVHAPRRLGDSDDHPDGTGTLHRRFSEIFTGRFDSNRMAAYLRKIAKTADTYRDVTVYDIPLQGRTVRVALLGAGIAAVSNTDGPAVIRGMIDRYKQIALPFGGPGLVREYYPHVSFASLAWGITRVNENGEIGGTLLPGGFGLFLPGGTVLVGSARYTGSVQFRAEAFTRGPEQAKRITEQTQAFLAIFRGVESSLSPQGPDPDVKAFFDSLKVEQHDKRAVLTATAPPGFLKKTFSGPPTSEVTGAEPTTNPAAKRK